MKINRFIALAAIALLVVGAMGFAVSQTFALGSHSPVAPTATCVQDQAGDAETTGAADADSGNPQCDQHGAPNEQDTKGETDDTETADDNGPTSTPAISVEQAQATALAAHPGKILKTELDNEDGKLLYSVKFDGGIEVKVDATTGAIVSTENEQD